MQREIVKFNRGHSGTLFIGIGGMHGNEPAGIEAIRTVGQKLNEEIERNPNFMFDGTFIGLLGNRKAFKKGVRYIEKDLNRMWTKENVISLLNSTEVLENEDQELVEFHKKIMSIIEENKSEKTVILDIHTTSSYGGIFSMPSNNSLSIELTNQIFAPAIIGILESIEGNLLNYLSKKLHKLNVITLAFESGQHTEELSHNRAVAFMLNCMKSVGLINSTYVDHDHDILLMTESKNLPKLSNLVSFYKIKHQGKFNMLPNFKNYQPIQRGQLLGYDGNNEIVAKNNGLIVMPLYQKKGNFGFFVVQPTSL